MKRENIIIKINIHIQHICLTDFAMRRVHRTYEATFYINTLNLKVNVLFSYSDSVSRPQQSKVSFHIVITHQPYSGWAFSGLLMDRGKRPLYEICQTYPAMMKLDTVIPYLLQIQKLSESHETLLEFCWHQRFFNKIQ